jgi:hypothetical protein
VLALGGKVGFDVLRQPAHIVGRHSQGDSPGEYEQQDHGKSSRTGLPVSGYRPTLS